jgi:hypothetical protein
MYFGDFRQRLLSYERLINVIFDDLMQVYAPKHLRVTMSCNPRGGIRSKLVVDSTKRSKDMVVSLRRGIRLKDVGVSDGMTLAQFLPGVADLKVIEDYPTGTTALIRIVERELKKLRNSIGDKCHIVPQSIGRANI